jgi:hypothetical protein
VAIESAATGMTHERVERRDKLILQPARYAPALAKAFVDALRSSGMEILEAYILTARTEDEKTRHMLFLIDFNGDRKRLFPLAAKAIRPYMEQGTNFELLKASPDLLDKARKTSKPSYIRRLKNGLRTGFVED